MKLIMIQMLLILKIYKIPNLEKFLKPEGSVVLDIGAYQSNQVKNMMNAVGFFDIRIVTY